MVQRLSLVVLFIIIVSAVGLRFYGLDWDSGYPYSPHPDERAMIYAVERITLDSSDKNLNPQWFSYGSLPLYLNFFTIELIEKLTTINDPSGGRLFGRVLSALAGVGTAVYFYLATVGFLGRRWSLFAVALLLFTVLHIQIGHFLTVDALLCFFIMGALYSLAEFIKRGSYKSAMVTGVWIGLGVATKLTAILIAPAVCVALFLYALRMKENLSIASSFFNLASTAFLRGGLILITAVVIAVICQPFMLADWAGFIEDVIVQGKMVVREIDFPYTRQYIATSPYFYNIWHLTIFGFGLPLGVLALAGVIFVFQRLSRGRIFSGAAFFLFSFILPAAMLVFIGGLLVTILALFVQTLATLFFLYRVNLRETPIVIILFFSWALSYFLFVGSLDVKFMRYMAPMVPPLIAVGVFVLKTLANHQPAVSVKKTTIHLLGGGVLFTTALYAIAFSSIYGGEEHPGVMMSKWIQSHVPEQSIILSEHWEEPIPYLNNYNVEELLLYEDDTKEKALSLSLSLTRADYIVFYSNRLYGTIPRLTERYPITSEYYKALFDGRLGFTLINTEEKRISFLCLSLFEDTFSSAGVANPGTVQSKEGCASINVGKTDESFSVYDHPRAMLFKNVSRLTEQEILSLLLNTKHRETFLKEYSTQASDLPFFTTKETKTGQVIAVFRWMILFIILGVLGLPFVYKLFEILPAKGVFFSKHLSLLIFCVFVWLFASTKIANFSKDAIYIGGGLFLILSLTLYLLQWNRILSWLKKEAGTILISEGLFFLAFLAFLFIRLANPDLWHPYLGGEKPMEMAYLSAIMRSPFMPPYDPWFAGEHLNYYYWGYFVVATIGNLLQITPALLFNLAVPSFFALTFVGCFGIGHALAGTWLRGTNLNFLNSIRRFRPFLKWPLLCGAIVSFSVVVIGNLDGLLQVLQNSTSCMFAGCERLFKDGGIVFDFWRSSRIMVPDPPGFEITEFPFFTFLFGDLHPHMMALPFTLLSICIMFAVFLHFVLSETINKTTTIVMCGVLGISIGSLRLLNAWDYPTYLIISVGVLFFANYIRNGGLALAVLIRSTAYVVWVVGIGYLVFLPFHLTYVFPLNSNGLLPIVKTTNTTTAIQFLTIFGLFFVIAVVWLFSEILNKADDLYGFSLWKKATVLKKYLYSILFICLAGGGLWWMSFFTGETVVLVLPAICLLSVLLFLNLRSIVTAKTAANVFILFILGVALLEVIGVEFFRLENDIDRMNTVFKSYMQIWVLFGIVAGVFLWQCFLDRRPSSVLYKRVSLWVIGFLVIGSLIYPVLGTHKRIAVRFDTTQPLTLNGTTYMNRAIYHDPGGEIQLSNDKEAIEWMLTNFKGLPVVAEAVTPIYRWGSRFSIYTGFPTVIGWTWHQQQQRVFSHQEINQRVNDVETLYVSKDVSDVKAIIKKYNIEYVVLGKTEEIYYYPKENSFYDAAISKITVPVYDNSGLKILSLENQKLID